MSLATGGLTCYLGAQYADTFDGQVGSANGLCVGGMWALISGATCEDADFSLKDIKNQQSTKQK